MLEAYYRRADSAVVKPTKTALQNATCWHKHHRVNANKAAFLLAFLADHSSKFGVEDVEALKGLQEYLREAAGPDHPVRVAVYSGLDEIIGNALSADAHHPQAAADHPERFGGFYHICRTYAPADGGKAAHRLELLYVSPDPGGLSHLYNYDGRLLSGRFFYRAEKAAYGLFFGNYQNSGFGARMILFGVPEEASPPYLSAIQLRAGDDSSLPVASHSLMWRIAARSSGEQEVFGDLEKLRLRMEQGFSIALHANDRGIEDQLAGTLRRYVCLIEEGHEHYDRIEALLGRPLRGISFNALREKVAKWGDVFDDIRPNR